MAKRKTSKVIDTEYDRLARENEALKGDISGRLGQARGRSDTLYNDLLSGYRGLLGRAGSSSARGGYEEFSGPLGGLDPSMVNALQGDIAGYRELARTGGAKGYYGNLIDTGGYSPEDISNIRQRSAASSPRFYQNLRANMEQANAAGGGYGPSFDAKLARESARATAEDQLGSEIGLSESIRQGKLAGAQGYSGNVLAGLGGASGNTSNLLNMISSGRKFGISGLDDLDRYGNATTEAALGGLSNLRTQVPGEEMADLNALMEAIGQGNQARAGNINQRMQQQQQKFGRKMQVLGLLTGPAAALFGGGGGGAMHALQGSDAIMSGGY